MGRIRNKLYKKRWQPYGSLFLDMNMKFLKLRIFVAIQDLTISFLHTKAQYISMSSHFRLVPPHFVCSDDGTDFI